MYLGSILVVTSKMLMGDLLNPIDLGDGKTAKQITAGANHTCAYKIDKNLYLLRMSRYRNILEKLSSKYNKTKIIDLSDYLCKKTIVFFNMIINFCMRIEIIFLFLGLIS